MRRVLYTMITTITLTAMVLLAYALSTAASTPVVNAPTPTPSATPVLPVCGAEDGAGMALCTWQGIVSGDCAPSVVGSEYTSRVCVQVHTLGTITQTNPDGATTTAYGPDMVGECVEIMQSGRMDSDTLTILEGEGWTILKCLRAQLGE
jgi:hypothetical protein